MIKVQNLTKTYRLKDKSIIAVDNISFAVNKGETVAFIGPNGAGKSTTIKMLCGILWPTVGEISVCGFNPQKEHSKLVYKIGAVFGQRSALLYNLPVEDSFELFGAMYRIPEDEVATRASELTELLEL